MIFQFISSYPAVLVFSKSDLSQWHVADGSPMAESYDGYDQVEAIPQWSEHYAHSSVYNMYPGVRSVIHSHCLSAIVYGLCNNWSSMLQPSYLLAGLLGTSPPIFDAASHYDDLSPSHPRNLLINNEFLGNVMAEMFHKSNEVDLHMRNGLPELPEQKVVFMAQADQPTAEGNCILNPSSRALRGHGPEKGRLVQLFPYSKMV